MKLQKFIQARPQIEDQYSPKRLEYLNIRSYLYPSLSRQALLVETLINYAELVENPKSLQVTHQEQLPKNSLKIDSQITISLKQECCQKYIEKWQRPYQLKLSSSTKQLVDKSKLNVNPFYLSSTIFRAYLPIRYIREYLECSLYPELKKYYLVQSKNLLHVVWSLYNK